VGPGVVRVKKESTAETHNRRRPLLGGNSPLIYLISAEIGKCVATKQRFFIFFSNPGLGEGKEYHGDRMVFSLLSGPSLKVGVVGWCLGQAPELGHQALQSLAEGIRCSALGPETPASMVSPASGQSGDLSHRG